jgi:purine-cytosine permease-like protein
MGALWASLGDMSDPVAGLRPLLPAWLYGLFIAAVIGGSVANNAPTFYSSGLSLQAAGLRLSRWNATLLDIAVSTSAVLYILFVQDLSTVLDAFVALLVAWSGPYAGVWLTDGVRRRWRLAMRDIHPEPGDAAATTGWRPAAWLAFGLGAGAAGLTLHSPGFVGPLARRLDGMDLSWILGFSVAAGAYAALSGRSAARSAD